LWFATISEGITELKHDTKRNIVARSDLYSSKMAQQITCFKKSKDPNVTHCNHAPTLAVFWGLSRPCERALKFSDDLLLKLDQELKIKIQ
jgi:hypothetical protein